MNGVFSATPSGLVNPPHNFHGSFINKTTLSRSQTFFYYVIYLLSFLSSNSLHRLVSGGSYALFLEVMSITLVIHSR